jgi:hypothetical protein
MAILTANNQSLTEITSLPSGVSGGALVLLATETASSSSTVEFDSDIDDTYDEYVFKFYDIHPATDDVKLTVGFRDGSTAYDATKTTTFFDAEHGEDGTGASLAYSTGDDLAQSTSFQPVTKAIGNGNDESCTGTLHLFSPSSTTFVKHFIARANMYYSGNYSFDCLMAGYCNTTTAIDGVQFKMSSGNIEAGTFKIYGVS